MQLFAPSTRQPAPSAEPAAIPFQADSGIVAWLDPPLSPHRSRPWTKQEETMCPIRVLLVDGSPHFVNSAARFLSMNRSIEIIGHCSSAQDALDRSQELAPDLILMDLGLPRTSAFDLTRQIKTIRPAIRVVLLGFHDNEHYRKAATDAGADAFLPKWEFASRVWPILARLFNGHLTGDVDEHESSGTIAEMNDWGSDESPGSQHP